MSSNDTAISVRNLSKCYNIYDRPKDRLKQAFYPRLQRILGKKPGQYHREFWALKDVSFEVKRGETVGIIGRNGSGKSTLLQIICGTLSPTGGEVEASGRIAALLELGSGFNPEFTGRENVYMNGAVLGLHKEEIEERFDAIISFADIGQFIDQPVKSYSSGMALRLAFSVQAQVEPDILVVDEALSVGDAKFQAKCFERLRQLKENGTSILLVTHSAEQIVGHCSRAMLLDQGCFCEIGEPRDVVNRYMDLLFGRERIEAKVDTAAKIKQPIAVPVTNGLSNVHPHSLNVSDDVFATRQGYNPHEYRWGDGAATILDFKLATDNEVEARHVESGASLTIYVAIRFNTLVITPIFGVTMKTKEGITIFGTNTAELKVEQFESLGQPGSYCIVSVNLQIPLAQGDYFISLGVASIQNAQIVPHDRRYDSIHIAVGPTPRMFGLVNLHAQIKVELVNNEKTDPIS